ncbi:uncharacterized protein LOC133196962 [Saccostrea echinata]|uniref:uncharacterized protein LOC133196962 n=1 Tax=Saccostrea echinata TaxID=191078 RepID=UPI002A7F9AAA|nr:uncharacterized protein LOC133196962 [Saccostrea echinata]
MDDFGYTPKNSSLNITLYTSIAPHTKDYFVSAESYQRALGNEPRILHSLVSSKDKTELVSDFEEKCERFTDVELQDLIQRTRTHIVPRLTKPKKIAELSKLLVCKDRQFQKFILGKLKCIICRLDISALPFVDIKSCLINLMKRFQRDTVEEDLEMWYESCLPIMDIMAISMLQYCFRNNEKKEIESKICDICKNIDDVYTKLSSKRKLKKTQPRNFAALKCMALFARSLSSGFQLSRHSRVIFERWEDAFYSKEHAEHLVSIENQSFNEQFMALFAFLLKLKSNASVHDQFLRFVGLLFLQKKTDKKWSEVQHHALAEITLRGIGACLCHPKGEKGDLLKVVEICWSRMSGHKSFLPLPEELSNHLFTGDKQLVNTIIQCLNISERSLLEFTETYVQRHVTDVVFHHTKRKTLPKKTDHSYWSFCQGRINKCEASIAICVPGISMSSLQGIKEKCKIKNSMLENDFKILLGLQKDETHINVVRLLAYSDLKNSLPFYVKENHRIEILEKLLEIRGQKTRFSVLWLNNRLIEMISALNYLHGKKIIHRDVTLRCFHLAQFPETEEDAAVLYDLNLACQTDFSMTASCQVADMQGDGFPIRWSAVESILLNCYDARSDIWMFGHVIHELFTYGCEPFTDQYSSTTDDIISGVLSGDISPYRWPCIPYDYHKLALSCWKTDPKDRPSAEEILKQLRRLRDKRVVGETPDLPRLSESQQERGHEPERGISPFIRKLKEKSLEKKENIRKTVIEMRRQSMPNPRSPLKEPVLDLDDIKPLHDPVVEETVNIVYFEQVSVQFCEKILPTMSPDFCEKMGIIADTLSREKGSISGKGIDNVLKYMYPKAVNILKLLKGNVSHHSCAMMLLAVAQLVQKMHAKRWLIVALRAKNIYIQHQENQYRAFLVKLGTMVRLPETPDINQGSIRVSDRFEDMIFWIPREVISFGELSTGSDVYTMAMLFYQVYMAFSGHDELQTVPFARNYKSQILGVLNEGQKPEKPEKCPDWLYDDVMIPCWHSDRSCRPSACDIVEIMTKRISENQDITSSSLKTDKRSFNNRDDTSPERIAEEQNLNGGYLDATDTKKQQCCEYDMLGQTVEDQYDDIANTNSTKENSFSSRMVESSSRSFTLNEKEMAQFEMDCQPSVPSTSTSSFISPNTNDTNLEFPIFRPTEPQPFRDKSQAFGDKNPESHNLKSNPLFQSFQSSVGYSASTSTDGIRKEEPKNKVPFNNVLTNPNSESVNKSSDFASSES